MIIDKKSHQDLTIDPDTALADLLMGNTTPLLAKAGISVIVAASKHYEAIGRSELVIKKIKKLMVSVLGLFNSSAI